MTTYYLRADGSDSNAGTGTTSGTAWKTLSKACSVAGAGDRVEIMSAGGVFYISTEHSFRPIGAAGNLLVITNYTAQSPIFDATGGAFGGTDAVLSVAAGSTYADIGGFTVRNCAQGIAKGRGIEISSTASNKPNHLTFRDIVIDNIWERGFGGGGDHISLIGLEVKNFCMRNYLGAMCIPSPGVCGGWASGIAPYSYSDGSLPIDWTIDDCYVHDGWGEGIICLRVTGMVVKNTFVKNAWSKSIYVDKAHDVELFNNILLFNDNTYRRSGRNTDGITWAVESAPVHSGYGVDNVLAYNNIIINCRDAFSWFTDSNTIASTYRNIHLYNNSCYALTGNGMRIERVGAIATAPSGCIVQNNIFYQSMSTLNNSSAWTFSHNRWSTLPAVGTHTNSFIDDPLYVSPNTTGTASGFELQATSPCSGNGIDVADVTVDYNGDARPDPPCMGAFENGEVVDPPPPPPVDPPPSDELIALVFPD